MVSGTVTASSALPLSPAGSVDGLGYVSLVWDSTRTVASAKLLALTPLATKVKAWSEAGIGVKISEVYPLRAYIEGNFAMHSAMGAFHLS